MPIAEQNADELLRFILHALETLERKVAGGFHRGLVHQRAKHHICIQAKNLRHLAPEHGSADPHGERAELCAAGCAEAIEGVGLLTAIE